MDSAAINAIKQHVRAANYLSAAQIFLLDNFLLQRKLSFDDIKPRLLGHWGTCPGINFIYAHLNYLIKKHQAPFLFVLGPGHGFPALQANLFIEGTLQEYYPEATHTEQGIGYIIKNFSWPYGFPSHSNPGTPGVILEGGELGYSLSTAYGAALDNPELIVACVIGDGEAETGAAAAAWHLNKLVDPIANGAVLPILHLNEYKISGPTLLGRMENKQLKSLFLGYGYEPLIVSGSNIHEKMLAALEYSYQKIRRIQETARTNNSLSSLPQFPVIILKTLKGWTGIKKLRGEKYEGNCLSHQIVLSNAKTDAVELTALETWLSSYYFAELFDKKSGFNSAILSIIPSADLRMGKCKQAFGGTISQPLLLPDINAYAEDAAIPGTISASSMRSAAGYLRDVFQLNAQNNNFRLFSPDETYSNKLNTIFEVTARNFTLPEKPWDKDLSIKGRVMEILSEHSLQGMLQGYLLTGRHGVFVSYEAFMQIVSSMADQYLKFLQIARGIPWRGKIPSMNYVLTSSGWRQEHNGFSHQNPGFISNLLGKHRDFVRVLFPPDANSMLVALNDCLASYNQINVIVAGKTQEPCWLTPVLAQKELDAGLMTWDFASDSDPHIVFAAAGDYMTKEALAAVAILKKEIEQVRVRFVNIMVLSENSNDWETYFTKDKPVIINFHGYPSAMQQWLFNLGNTQRFSIYGYIENGSTTTPFDMHVLNHTSRWHLALAAFEQLAKYSVITASQAEQLCSKYHDKLLAHRHYIQQFGSDPEEVDKAVLFNFHPQS